MMPVVTLGDARLRNIDGNLTALRRSQELGEGTAVIAVGLQRIRAGTLGIIAFKRAPKLLGERAVSKARNHKIVAARLKRFEQGDDLTQRHMIGGVARAEIPPSVSSSPL